MNIIIIIIINYFPHLFYKAFLFATNKLSSSMSIFTFSIYSSIHFQSHFCQEQFNIKRFTLPHLSNWYQPFPHKKIKICVWLFNWGFSLFMTSFNSEFFVGFFAHYTTGIGIHTPWTCTYIILYIIYYIVNYLLIYSLLSIQWYRDTRALNLDSSRGGVSLENEKTPQVSLTIGRWPN